MTTRPRVSISLLDKPDPSASVLKNQSVYLPDSTKPEPPPP
jgi:hypothetical protein